MYEYMMYYASYVIYASIGDSVTVVYMYICMYVFKHIYETPCPQALPTVGDRTWVPSEIGHSQKV